MLVRSADVQTREKHRKDKRARSKVLPVFLELAICCRFVLMCLRVTPVLWHFHVKTMSSHRQTTLHNISLCVSVRTEKGKVLLSWLRLKKESRTHDISTLGPLLSPILRRKFRERFCRGSPARVIIYIKHPNYGELIKIIKHETGIFIDI